MDYERIYDEFISDRRTREAALIASGEYTERHHVVPRALGGSDDADNMITLSYPDHFFAHLLLAKAHGFWHPVRMMANTRSRLEACRARRWGEVARYKGVLPSTRAKLAEAGRNSSPDVRAKLAEAARNRSPEHRAKLAEAARNRSPEVRAKVAEATRNRSPEVRAKVAEALRYSRSPEHRAKIAEALRGRVRSAETRAKIAETRRGKGAPRSPEGRAKIAEANRRRAASPEARSKAAEGCRAYWARRRAAAQPA